MKTEALARETMGTYLGEILKKSIISWFHLKTTHLLDNISQEKRVTGGFKYLKFKCLSNRKIIIIRWFDSK